MDDLQYQKCHFDYLVYFQGFFKVNRLNYLKILINYFSSIDIFN